MGDFFHLLYLNRVCDCVSSGCVGVCCCVVDPVPSLVHHLICRGLLRVGVPNIDVSQVTGMGLQNNFFWLKKYYFMLFAHVY